MAQANPPIVAPSVKIAQLIHQSEIICIIALVMIILVAILGTLSIIFDWNIIGWILTINVYWMGPVGLVIIIRNNILIDRLRDEITYG
jgi:intracellular septation protein A